VASGQPDAAPWRWSTWGLLIVAGSVVAALRVGPASQRFALGSEDGRIFTQQVRELGVVRSIFTTYAGYFHLVPRVIAALASPFSLDRTPLIYGIAAALVAGSCGAIVARCTWGMGLTMPVVALMWVAGVLLPASGWETAMWLTMAEWYVIATFVVFAGAWVAGYDPPGRWTWPILLVAGLTSPLLVTSLPFLLVAAWRRHRRSAWVVPGIVAATAVVHLVGRAISAPPSGAGHWTVDEIIRMYAVRVVGGAIGGANGLSNEVARLGVNTFYVLGVLAVVGLSLAAFRLDLDRRIAVWYLVYASVAYLAMAIVLRPAFFAHTLPIGEIVRDGRHTFWNLRYMAAPVAALTLAVLVFVDRGLRRGSVPTRAMAWTALCGLAVVLAVNVPVYLHRDTVANWDAQVAAARDSCAHHMTTSVRLTYGPFTSDPVWHLTLTCRQAFGTG
jgi:hypothetical protein